MTFTIFTPAYNRAHTLPRLYNSLLSQTEKDFEWLIIDDGSTDDTESLVKSFIEDDKINIRYYKQENAGKHIAINKALEEAQGEYIITIDSDDYLEKDAVEVCEGIKNEVNDLPDFAGFTFIHTSEQSAYDRNDYGNKRWTRLGEYEWNFKGEMQWVFKREIIKKYPFPVYEGEKFCQEAVQLLRVLRDYKILFTDNILAHGDYLEDGLSQNLYKRLLQNPKYAMLSYSEKIASMGTEQEKLQMAKSYWDIAMKTGGGFWQNLGGIPFHYTFKVFGDKILNKK